MTHTTNEYDWGREVITYATDNFFHRVVTIFPSRTYELKHNNCFRILVIIECHDGEMTMIYPDAMGIMNMIEGETCVVLPDDMYSIHNKSDVDMVYSEVIMIEPIEEL